MIEKSNSNAGTLTYHLDEPFFKMRVSARFTNMSSFITKGISSSGNPFCSLAKDVKKCIQIDLNPIMSKEFSLNNVIFLNKFEQRLFVSRMRKFHDKLMDNSNKIFRRNNVDGIDCYDVVEYEISKYKVYDNIILSSGKNIEFVPTTDKTKDDIPFCGVMMAINRRSKYIIMTPDEFEYFMYLISSIDIEKCFTDAISMMYLSDLNKSGKIINNKGNQIKVVDRINKPEPVSDYVDIKPTVNKLPF